MKYDLTLTKIKNTDFNLLYDRFIIGEKLSEKQYEILLAVAICFINANDVSVQRLGYRIIVEYCNQSREYHALYEIAINTGLYPVSKFIEKNYIGNEEKNFFTEWNDAFTEQYAIENVYQSEQQNLLFKFFREKKNDTISIIAPTSYGKSELILSAIKENVGKKVCVITSTKALLTQTKQRVQKVSKDLFPKIVVHPEMYNSKDKSCLAILTQERLLRLLKKDSTLKFDCIIVDEAHEMLEDTSRSRILASVIIVAQKRNPDITFKFLTPFLMDNENLKIRYTAYNIEGFKVSEYIKTEKYYLYDLRNKTGLKFYDQFLDTYLPIKSIANNESEENFIREHSATKNIIYLNKPVDIEKFALSLAKILPDVNSESIEVACNNIADYLQPQYNLLTCLRKGIIYHHGSVPDAIRFYVEDLYKNNSNIKYVICSSTLLSGVNLPAERMFILDNRRGRKNLTYDAFQNLVGRVCRFSEVFNSKEGSLQKLEPHIYLVFGKYFARNANCEKFLRDVANVKKAYKDKLENVLLQQTKISNKKKNELHYATEFVENYETGTIAGYKDRYTKTDLGKACIMNGVSEFNVFACEEKIQEKVDVYINNAVKISNSNDLLEIINELFIQYLPENQSESLKRLEHKEARNFYAMMFEWRICNKSYAEMISLFVRYWKKLYEKNEGKWGDVRPPRGNTQCYTRLKGKNKRQVINLAIVRIKEEQDFIDNRLIKYVEVLYDLELIDEAFYAQIKYGTDNELIICLIKNGLSLSSAVLLMKKYRDYLIIDLIENTVKYRDALLSEMVKAGENEILIYEVRSCM